MLLVLPPSTHPPSPSVPPELGADSVHVVGGCVGG